MKKLLYLSISIFVFISCAKQEATEEVPKNEKLAFDGIDDSIKPGDNFFMHVNKEWYDNAVIADDQVGVGSYSFLNIPQKVLLENILEDVSAGQHPAGSIEQKVGDFYASGMDLEAINQRGFEPIKPTLNRIDIISDIPSLMSFVTEEIEVQNNSIISLSVSADNENSEINILHFNQSGLGLPDRDYYFKTDSSTLSIQKAYKQYISTLLELTGHADAPKLAETVYDIEKELAKSHKTRIERRDIKANYNKMALSAIDKNQANIGWAKMLSRLGLEADSVDMRQPAYYDKLNEMLSSVSIEDWKTYLKASAIVNYADYLSKPFEDAAFEYTKVLLGQSDQKTR
ncbi:MAG: M13 family metallopeptidase N-terminal domain-containing protein, partial [Fulvivirga sp.]